LLALGAASVAHPEFAGDGAGQAFFGATIVAAGEVAQDEVFGDAGDVVALAGQVDADFDVSVVMTERQKPGYEFCIKVAQALKEAPEKVLRLAELLPSRPARDAYYEALDALWAMTPEWKKQDIVLQLRATVEEYQHKFTAQEKQRQQRVEPSYPSQEGVPLVPEGEDWLDILARIWSEISREKNCRSTRCCSKRYARRYS
jgi:hypothetical protein